jgi:hypothetical protein
MTNVSLAILHYLEFKGHHHLHASVDLDIMKIQKLLYVKRAISHVKHVLVVLQIIVCHVI